jgi:hypothetical protein
LVVVVRRIHGEALSHRSEPVNDNIDRRNNTLLRSPEATLFPLKEFIFRDRNSEVAASETRPGVLTLCRAIHGRK